MCLLLTCVKKYALTALLKDACKGMFSVSVCAPGWNDVAMTPDGCCTIEK